MKKYHCLLLALAILGLSVPSTLVWAKDLSPKQLAQIDQAAEKAALKQQIQEEEIVNKFFQVLRKQSQRDVESFAEGKTLLYYNSCLVPSSVSWGPWTDYDYPESEDGPWEEAFTDGRHGGVGVTYMRKGGTWYRKDEGSECYADRYASEPLEHKKFSLPQKELQELVGMRRQRAEEKRKFLVQIGVPERYTKDLKMSADDVISVSPACKLLTVSYPPSRLRDPGPVKEEESFFDKIKAHYGFGDGYVRVKRIIWLSHPDKFEPPLSDFFYIGEYGEWTRSRFTSRFILNCYSQKIWAGRVKEEPWQELTVPTQLK